MPRKMICVPFALALLVLMSGAVQAQPVAAPPAPAGFFEQVWQWAVASVAPIFSKDGSTIDPNGRTQWVQPDDSGSPRLGTGRLFKVES